MVSVREADAVAKTVEVGREEGISSANVIECTQVVTTVVFNVTITMRFR